MINTTDININEEIKKLFDEKLVEICDFFIKKQNEWSMACLEKHSPVAYKLFCRGHHKLAGCVLRVQGIRLVIRKDDTGRGKIAKELLLYKGDLLLERTRIVMRIKDYDL